MPGSADRPLRILHLVGAAEDNGGVLSVVRNITAASGPLGIQHATLVHASFDQIRRPTLDLRRSRYLLMEHPSSAALLYRGLRTVPELRRLLAAERFDILHAHSRGPLVAAALAAAFLGCRALFTNHAFARGRAVYQMAARWPRLWTTMLTPNMARHYGIEPRPPRVSIVSECAADGFFSAPLSPEPSLSQARPLRLVGVGNIVRWKNWSLLLDALAQLPGNVRSRFRFDLWGPVAAEDDARRYDQFLRETITSRGLSDIAFLRGPTLDVPAALADADFFVLPSTNEPCSVALIEALAQGIPALVSQSGGNVDILKDGITGRWFLPDDPASFASVLAEIASGAWHPASRAEIRASVQSRSASAVAAELSVLYRQRAQQP
ncbi:MAG: glycosyltransferase family 4 protein [Verrucomicrobiota bacterium]